MVILGCGGGPLETDCSGYLVKPLQNRWEDGVLALEGGSGIGALANLLKTQSPASLFPTVVFPETHTTPVLQAAYIFSFLTCYLITHAHLDHAASLIMMSGSVPPRIREPYPSGHAHTPSSGTTPPIDICPPRRIPVYARRETLDKLASAYGGGLWPELSTWASGQDPSNGGKRKRRRVEEDLTGVGPMFSTSHSQLHWTLPVSTLMFPTSHGCTSQGAYPSSAVFVRYDPSLLSSEPHSSTSASASQSKLSTPPDDESVAGDGVGAGTSGREFLFFGDVESAWRAPSEEHIDKANGDLAHSLNHAIWHRAAQSFAKGQLSAIFIECSYDSSRPAALMYGHLSPPGILHELQTMVFYLPAGPSRPLEGLKVYVTHIKEYLVPHPTGLSSRELVRKELLALTEIHDLGVEFHIVSPGDRLCEYWRVQLRFSADWAVI
ncbi:hypothetical protein VHUM_02483 [Vanrija humicola]|uniref:3',5'-cyclic-nucleotide phosphodiesterase n=1 Tax=Vanrija humicola TaxID=5417 RepID=A0A7D8V163_VANHU|nr:hypothetical protein VHUM_02483 [Vanrija humicola]